MKNYMKLGMVTYIICTTSLPLDAMLQPNRYSSKGITGLHRYIQTQQKTNTIKNPIAKPLSQAVIFLVLLPFVKYFYDTRIKQRPQQIYPVKPRASNS